MVYSPCLSASKLVQVSNPISNQIRGFSTGCDIGLSAPIRVSPERATNMRMKRAVSRPGFRRR